MFRKVFCPNCGERVKLPTWIGARAICPRCAATLRNDWRGRLLRSYAAVFYLLIVVSIHAFAQFLAHREIPWWASLLMLAGMPFFFAFDRIVADGNHAGRNMKG
jgi:uncharacterized paraquat-inducible protein A